MTTEPPVPDPAPWTRGVVARELGVSIATVRRLEDSGDLTPAHGPKGLRIHDRAQVLALKDLLADRSDGRAPDPTDPGPVARTSVDRMPPIIGGAVAALAFEDFEEGLLPVDVVIRRKLTPDIVEELHAQWARMREMPWLESVVEHLGHHEQRLRHLEKMLGEGPPGPHAAELWQHIHGLRAAVHGLYLQLAGPAAHR